MRVLHVTHQYPPAIGGSEKYIADLSEELVRRGHQVDVFTSRSLDYHTWRNELDPFEVRNGVNIHRFRSIQRRRFHWWMLHFGARHYWRTRARRYETLMFLGGGPLCPGMFRQLLVQAPKYDLIHLNCLVYAQVAYGYAAARRRGVPSVVTPHAHSEQEVTYGLEYQRAILKGCAHVLADTPAERRFLIDAGVVAWRITTAGIGLRSEDYPRQDPLQARHQLGLPEEAFVLLFLGRKAEYKGFDLTLKAFQALQPDHQKLHLLAAGPDTEFSKSLLACEQVPPGFVNLGAVSEETKLAALNACDCLVLPSGGEAFGIVYLEAWIMGKPVVGSRTPAVSTVIDHGRDGFLTAQGDINDLVGCLARMLEAPKLAREMGAQGQAKVLSRYTAPRIADVVEGVYLRVLRRRWQESRRSRDDQPVLPTRVIVEGE
jgi:glycosyltransferase involved in cell wall biosynthesis